MPTEYSNAPSPTTGRYTSPEDNSFDPAAAKAYDLEALLWDTPERISESLAIVQRALFAKQISPSQAKASATVATQSLKALSLSVQKQIKELKDAFDAREAEAKGAGRRGSR